MFRNFVVRYISTMNPFSLLVAALLSCPLFAQPTTGSQLPRANFMDQQVRTNYAASPGITVHQSAEIQMLSNRFKLENNGKANLKGFKVQVFVGERATANDIKARFSSIYPEVPAEIDYFAPNFRVRVGNFRSNLEADRFLRQIKSDFGNAFIVADQIALPAL